MSNTTTIHNAIPRADIIKHAVRLGAEIKNIRLSDELSDEVIRAISRLLLEHKVIFFRDQGHLDDAEQQRFAIRLGSLIPRPAIRTTKGASTPAMASGRRSGLADQMHMDVSFGDACPKISVVRGAVIPPYGGEIVWSSTAAAYLALPEPLRMLADNLWAVRCNAYDYTVAGRATEDKNHFDDVFTGTNYETAYPVVRVHPETGERMLVIGRFVQHFVGLQKYTSQKLFDLLQSYLAAPENTVCWGWKSGDVAIWDNRATEQHAVNKSGNQHRMAGHAAIDSDVPLSIVGRRSVTRIKRPKPQATKAA
ncbi:TauD/TfdA family dioxygenase [Bradyrhizobium sp. CSA112]|uniref:TauD/TfdA dioxygenase family protein n=1 Tax=Bradyrhizobium sp. CSA112 TaxID=2699170 RepID=UPI0023AFF9A0|nr:TauD/TfdA family dioxygenase [Bradyrhizobium sp. CSA112]MDE5458636.1 TauD/TfdA family dioxygenase [Bradyrhizobium sp. CSA112]